MNTYISMVTGKASPSPSPITYPVTLDDTFALTKTIQVQNGEVQKENEDGLLLYLDADKVETSEARIATAWENKEVPNMVTVEEEVDSTDAEGVTTKVKTGKASQVQDGTIIIKVESAWIENSPIMIPNMLPKTVDFKVSPEEFTVEDIMGEKYKSILNSSSCSYVLADMFVDELDLNLEDALHRANTGVGLLQLLPNGQAITKPITLATSEAIFTLLEFDAGSGADIYINDVKLTDGKATLPAPVATCILKFMNTTDKPVLVKAYAVGY